MIQITEKLLPTKTKRRSGQKLAGVRFLVLHDTGNDGSTATGNVNYFTNSANDMQASAHFFVDDKNIICCIPETEKAWHVNYDLPRDNNAYGKDANDWALSIELCWSSKKLIDNIKSYNNYVDLAAYICKKYNLDPDKDIVSHAWLDPARRTDPISALKLIGKDWNTLLKDIAAKIKPAVSPTPVKKDFNDLIIKIEEVEKLSQANDEKIKSLWQEIKAALRSVNNN